MVFTKLSKNLIEILGAVHKKVILGKPFILLSTFLIKYQSHSHPKKLIPSIYHKSCLIIWSQWITHPCKKCEHPTTGPIWRYLYHWVYWWKIQDGSMWVIFSDSWDNDHQVYIKCTSTSNTKCNQQDPFNNFPIPSTPTLHWSMGYDFRPKTWYWVIIGINSIYLPTWW